MNYTEICYHENYIKRVCWALSDISICSIKLFLSSVKTRTKSTLVVNVFELINEVSCSYMDHHYLFVAYFKYHVKILNYLNVKTTVIGLEMIYITNKLLFISFHYYIKCSDNFVVKSLDTQVCKWHLVMLNTLQCLPYSTIYSMVNNSILVHRRLSGVP